MILANEFAEMLTNHKSTLRGYMDEATQYGVRADVDRAALNLTIAWAACRRGQVDFEAIYRAQDDADEVMDAVVCERWRRVCERELVNALVLEFGERATRERIEADTFEPWEIERALASARAQSGGAA